MILVTVADMKFQVWADILKASTDKLGHELRIYKPRWKGQKAIRANRMRLVMEAREQLSGRIFWMDADMLLRHRLDLIDTEGFDVAIYVKRRKDGQIRFKGGLGCLQDSSKARYFVSRWVEQITGASDQQTLNRWIGKYYPNTHETADREFLDVEGVRVKLMKDQYMHEVYLPEDLPSISPAKIVIAFNGKATKVMNKFNSKMDLYREYIKLYG